MHHFLLRPRWLVRHVLAAVMIAGCLGLSMWQADRLADRKADNARLTSQTRLAPVELQSLLQQPAVDAVYRRVSVTGTYDAGREVLLLTRSFKGRPGNHLLTPLVMASGGAVIVDRGWVPLDIDRPGAGQAAPPAGEVSLTGILLPSEKKSPLGVSDPPPGPVTALARVDLQRVGAQLPYPILTTYLRLQDQNPAGNRDIPKPVPLPPLSEGPHLGYAVQWLFFGLVGLVVYVCLLRREIRNRPNDEDPDEEQDHDMRVAQSIR